MNVKALVGIGMIGLASCRGVTPSTAPGAAPPASEEAGAIANADHGGGDSAPAGARAEGRGAARDGGVVVAAATAAAARPAPATLFGTVGGRRILDARYCAETRVCGAAALAVEGTAEPRVGLLVLPAGEAVPSGVGIWIDLAPGDGAVWLAPVDLATTALGADEASIDLASLPEGADLRFPAGAGVPAFVVTTSSSRGVRVGSDEGVTGAVAVAALRDGALRRVLLAAVSGAEDEGRAFRRIGSFGLHRGEGPLLDFGWVEHVTPAPGDVPFRPGPPLHVRLRFDGTEYVR
jgi:hypothetical protein